MYENSSFHSPLYMPSLEYLDFRFVMVQGQFLLFAKLVEAPPPELEPILCLLVRSHCVWTKEQAGVPSHLADAEELALWVVTLLNGELRSDAEELSVLFSLSLSLSQKERA